MWRILYESVQGTSHRRSGLVCQDSCVVNRIEVGETCHLLMACADGAGSAVASEHGARVACETIVRLAADFLGARNPLSSVDRQKISRWFEDVQRALILEAGSRSLDTRDLACTLLFAALGPECAVYAQIGDGAIVISDGDSYTPVFWPQTGEYHNTTNFVTEATCLERLQTDFLARAPNEVAMFTDGLQMLALSYANRSAHKPFFEPLFRSLRAAGDPADLLAPMRQFLDSEAVNARTDDDKSLILAARVGGGDDQAV